MDLASQYVSCWAGGSRGVGLQVHGRYIWAAYSFEDDYYKGANLTWIRRHVGEKMEER